MRFSNFWIPTRKEIPAEAEVISHQLMLRAGMIRQSALGIYSWLPLGLKVLNKVAELIRQEMNKAGALEVLMPATQSEELWQLSGRWDDYGAELLRFEDRHKRKFCFGPTHEEVITDLVKKDLTSFRQLPLNFYQIQWKFRDEIRPRFGVMRAREFLMKDAYSFDIDEEGLQKSYDNMFKAYCNIFEALGLKYRPVLADNGSIGGNSSHEFHVLAQTGEDAIVFADTGTYAANIEKAATIPPNFERPAPSEELKKVETPKVKTIADLVEQFKLPIEKTLKTLLVNGADGGIVALVVRGDHELNEVKAEHLPEVAKPLKMAEEAKVKQIIGASFGSLGAVGMDKLNIPVIVDYAAAKVADFAIGANEDGYHYFGVNWERDCSYLREEDLRNVVEGDPSPDGVGTLHITRGIEVGHVFQLGKKYSQAMGLKVLMENGEEKTVLMGCYGIGVSRVVAAAIEQNHDERGIIWTKEITPFDAVIIPINAHKSAAVKEAAEKLYADLTAKGLDIALDDRNLRAGVMFADADLIGIPARIVISDKTLANNCVEFKFRTQNEAEILELEPEKISKKVRN